MKGGRRSFALHKLLTVDKGKTTYPWTSCNTTEKIKGDLEGGRKERKRATEAGNPRYYRNKNDRQRQLYGSKVRDLGLHHKKKAKHAMRKTTARKAKGGGRKKQVSVNQKKIIVGRLKTDEIC